MLKNHVQLNSKSGVKYDQGKPQIWSLLLTYFPRALEAVCRVSEFGARKYAANSWRGLPNGFVRYSDALSRHLLADGAPNDYRPTVDDESGLLHAAHAAWDALARLEIALSAPGQPPQDVNSASVDPRAVLVKLCGEAPANPSVYAIPRMWGVDRSDD